MTRYEYKVIDTGSHIEEQLNGPAILSAGWKRRRFPAGAHDTACRRWSQSIYTAVP